MATKASPRTFRQLMADRGIVRQNALAAASGVCNPTITLILRHGVKPSEPTAKKLAKALGVTVDDVFAAARAQREATS